MNPGGRGLFEFTKHIGEAMRGLEADKEMDVVGRAADAFWKTTQTAKRASQIVVEARSP